jgi:hypothetical protein
MSIYFAKCLQCSKEFDNNTVSPRSYCSVACQFAEDNMDIKSEYNTCANFIRDVDDIRGSFDPELSTKANVLQILKRLAMSNYDEHYKADMALLALINDPDIIAAYSDIYPQY